MATLKRSFVLSKQHNFQPASGGAHAGYNPGEEDNIWDLCKELEELGGGI